MRSIQRRLVQGLCIQPAFFPTESNQIISYNIYPLYSPQAPAESQTPSESAESAVRGISGTLWASPMIIPLTFPYEACLTSRPKRAVSGMQLRISRREITLALGQEDYSSFVLCNVGSPTFFKTLARRLSVCQSEHP